ncbi:MAG: phenylacetate-CoA oxygenase subunit PaaJ [Proteobacteria bacterium]|nr:MAG: phenylacetate-CoA oxygenase subunit PaaJ [Pseudomonadota bacterium]
MNANRQQPDDTAAVWACLETVPDPEIPVISVVELGIIRDVAWRNEDGGRTLHVTITPTYSGCPATDAIAGDIESALRAQGVERVRIESKLAPAWTTDWITDTGRRKLAEYGIAPPRRLAQGETPSCPHCGAANTERVSQFGSTPCKALYRCRGCLEPFDYFKCH